MSGFSCICIMTLHLNLYSSLFQLGILCHHLLYWGSPRYCHLDDQKNSCCWRWAWWTQNLQDHFSSNLCLLLGFLCCHFCSGSLWSHQPRILRKYWKKIARKKVNLSCWTLCCDSKRFKNIKKNPTLLMRRLQNLLLQSEPPQPGTLDLQLSPSL